MFISKCSPNGSGDVTSMCRHTWWQVIRHSATGSVCRTVDDKTCLGADVASVVTAGALEGTPSELRLGVLTIHDGRITVAIRASSDQEALALANSLVTAG